MPMLHSSATGALSYLALPLCYLLGALPFGVLYGKVVKGVDIRQVGSGNTGASNVLRLFGFRAFLIVFLLDAGKGFFSVYLCRLVFGYETHWLILLGGVLAIVGHNWSVFLKFTGGRGVATGLGVVFAVAPVVALSGWAAWGVVLAVTRYISLASIVAGVVTPILTFIIKYPQPCPLPYQVLIGAAGVLVILRHRANIHRLRMGTEYKLGQKIPLSGVEPQEGPIDEVCDSAVPKEARNGIDSK